LDRRRSDRTLSGIRRVRANLRVVLLLEAVTVALATGLVLVHTQSSSGAVQPFFTGPAGKGIILPPRKGAFFGTAQSGEESVASQLARLESSIGRKIDIEHRYMQRTCSLDVRVIRAAARRGHIPMISWFPDPANGGDLLRGGADPCIRSVGRQIARQPYKILLRPYWEFNGDWMPWSRDIDGSLLTAEEHKAMWRRTVDRLRQAEAFPKASIVWCPNEGHYGNGDAFDETVAYPGDAYVDWVCSDGYNFNSSLAWCGQHAGWCDFSEIFHDQRNVEQDFRGRKPLLVGETGTVEDLSDPKRKGNWFRDARTFIKSSMPGARGLVYFDIAYTDGDWRIATTQASLAGLRELVSDPYFNTRRAIARPSSP
jgi:Glycosyl hydrolase family 26